MTYWLIGLVNLAEICSKPYLSNKSIIREKKIGSMGIWYFADRPVKYARTPLWDSGFAGAFDLKYSPVIDIDHLRQCAKFQFGHLRDWYFTDRSAFYPKCSFSA